MDSKTSLVAIKFSNVQSYTLTTSYVASDIININCDKSLTIYPFYTAGSGSAANTLTFTIEVNPYTAVQDPTNIYFSPLNGYVNTSGVHAEQTWTFDIVQGAASTLKLGTPLALNGVIAERIRIKAKETVLAGSAGTVYFLINKSNYF